MKLIEILKSGARIAFTVNEVTDEVFFYRLGICESCQYFDALRRCDLCGCFMDVKAKSKSHRNIKKLRTEITHCPEGKWNDIEISKHYKNL